MAGFVFVALLALVSVPVTTVLGDEDVILKPVKDNGYETCYIILQGAEITTDAYVPLASQLQETYPYTLWVGIPKFPLDVAEPLAISEGVERILGSLRDAGMNTTNIFLGGHSLGGIGAQMYSFNHSSEIVGQVLMGSYLTREYENATYPVRTLTIGGELDGLTRVTRIMESYYHLVLNNPSNMSVSEASVAYPVVVLEGVSHMQFASGTPPAFVKAKDLQPEVSYEEAHEAIANVTSLFLRAIVEESDPNPVTLSSLREIVSVTYDFLEPLFDAFTLEGFNQFKPPCDTEVFNPGPYCTRGCQWTEMAMAIMGSGLSYVRFNITDKFHNVADTHPIHLAHVWNNCTFNQSDCVLNITTVSQGAYAPLDELDTSVTYISAYEIRAKLISRQKVYIEAGLPDTEFNVTDSASLCAEINEVAYQWALNNSGVRTLSRYDRIGEPLVFGPDRHSVSGPGWIWGEMEYQQTDDEGNHYLNVTSNALATPAKYFVPLAAGFHYCKLLSPARAMEWIYIDGLRLNGSISTQDFLRWN